MITLQHIIDYSKIDEVFWDESNTTLVDKIKLLPLVLKETLLYFNLNRYICSELNEQQKGKLLDLCSNLGLSVDGDNIMYDIDSKVRLDIIDKWIVILDGITDLRLGKIDNLTLNSLEDYNSVKTFLLDKEYYEYINKISYG